MSDVWPALIDQLGETASVEFKSAAPWGKIKQKVMRTAIAMANTPDGGHIVDGVRQSAGGYIATGLSAEHARTYARIEELQAQVSRCAAPNLEVAISLLSDDSGRRFAVFRVGGLRSMPHIAVRTFEPDKQGIVRGVVYVRTNLPSSEPCDQFLWESLMSRAGADMATEFLRRMRKAGCGLQLAPSLAASERDDEALFRLERGAE